MARFRLACKFESILGLSNERCWSARIVVKYRWFKQPFERDYICFRIRQFFNPPEIKKTMPRKSCEHKSHCVKKQNVIVLEFRKSIMIISITIHIVYMRLPTVVTPQICGKWKNIILYQNGDTYFDLWWNIHWIISHP